MLGAAAQLALDAGVVKDGWNGFSVLHIAAGRVGALELCALPRNGGRDTAGILDGARAGDIELVYLLGADEIDMAALGKAFVIYQGTHGDAGANRADIILPGAAYSEKSSTFLNTEGRPQLTRRALFPPGEARDDWAILRALSERVGATLPFDTLDGLRSGLYDRLPHLGLLDEITPADPAGLAELAAAGGALRHGAFRSPIKDYYFTNPIARASKIMAECSKLRRERRLEAAE